MAKKLAVKLEEANNLVHEISRKLKLKPAVSLEFVEEDLEVSNEAKELGCFLIVSKLQENTAPIFVLDTFFENERFWRRFLAHECAHIKTLYNGLPYLWIENAEEGLPAFINKVPITPSNFSDQLAKYKDLGDLYGPAKMILFIDLRDRIHDHLANIEAVKVDFADDYALFAEYELNKFLDLKFIEQPYLSKLILMDLSEKFTIIDTGSSAVCKEVTRKFDDFFARLEEHGLLGYIENCKGFFKKLEFTRVQGQMIAYQRTGLSVLLENLTLIELKKRLDLTLQLLLKGDM